ncbi:unnamed protein product [Ilex paraguariensis]|uniref:Uncharacterized protein n=1 Tax=Ilex paraguariensis TaxID=185542 RepID=A0ABC8UGU2_9AQUA
MENLIVNAEKDGKEKEDHSEDHGLSKRLVRKVEPKNVLILNGRKSQSGELCKQELFLKGIRGIDNRFPKRIMSFDEKYLRRCLEMIHISALRAASFNIYPEMSVCSKEITSRDRCDLVSLGIGCSLSAETDNVAISSTGDWILGTITGSKSMLNILKSPLFHQIGASDCDVKFGGTSFIDDKELLHSDFMSSSYGLSISSSQKLQKEMAVLGDHRYGSEPVHKRLVSVSSTISSCSNQSYSASATVSLGMLQCTWKDGLPNYIFSLDDHREVYVAEMCKVESSDDKVLDYMYNFHSRAGSKKKCAIHEDESDLVAKMRVSTSITLCPNNSQVMETQFVLFGSDNYSAGEIQTSSHTHMKNKGLSKKMVDVFRKNQSYKQRTPSKFWGTSAILENSTWELCQDSRNKCDPVRANLSDKHLPPNCELAAIIVKDHIHDNRKDAELGGWGLKFLKKAGIKQTNASLDTSEPSECCRRDSGDCSTSMDIIVPAGFHGGPRTRYGGPSSLIERWNSGGHCDCGGWDIGCPLTVLNTRPSRMGVSPQTEIPGECRTVDLCIQGSKQNTPIMKMANIHDGLHYVHFQSTLSALQSFSIAVAVIHTCSPTLRPKVYRS